MPLPDATALHAILRSTLTALGATYPALSRLADHPGLVAVAARAIGLDGRRTRKAVFQALARDRATVLSPGLLTLDSLAATLQGAADQQKTPAGGGRDAAN